MTTQNDNSLVVVDGHDAPPAGAVQGAIETVIRSITPGPLAPRSSAWMRDPTVCAFNTAFMLGWKIVELRSRINMACNLVNAGKPAAKDPFWLASVWHGIFMEIATMQMTAFQDQTTQGTFYEPNAGWQKLLGYLYPVAPAVAPEAGAGAGILQYWNIGIGPDKQFSFLDADVEKQTKAFSAFSLYDVTRRALNCLLLLHAKAGPATALLVESLDTYREPLVQALDTYREPLVQALDTYRVPLVQALKLEPDQQTDPVKLVTKHCVQLLDAWDSFLRENYYSGGRIPNDVTEKTAYEAGSALARLTWELSEASAQVRLTWVPTKAAAEPSGTADKADDPAPIAGDPGLVKALHTAWQRAFDPKAIVFAQHQLTALGTVLDNAYYRVNNKSKPPNVPGADAPFDPDLPSATLSCLSRSLDFWHDTVDWLDPTKAPDHPMTDSMEAALSTALVEQANVWQALITGQQSLDGYAVNTVMHAIVEAVIKEFEQEIQTELKQSVSSMLLDSLRRVGPVVLLVLGVVVCLSIPAAIWLYVARPTIAGGINPNGLWGILGIGPALAAVVGYRATTQATRKEPATTTVATSSAGGGTSPTGSASTAVVPGGQSSVADFLGGVMRTVDAALVAMLHAAQVQIHIDLAALNHQIGMSYPLIESVVASSKGNIKNDYAFMTEVIWSTQERKEEALSIVRAALGPLGIMISTHALATKTANAQQAQGT
jgi:hypothetical protein